MFPAICKYQPELANKITGMMLEKDNSELLALLGSEQKLRSMIDEMTRVLKDTGHKKVCEYDVSDDKPCKAVSSDKLFPKRGLVELCCGPSSLLGQPGPNTEGCEVIRITELEDILTEEGQKLAFEAVDFPNVMV